VITHSFRETHGDHVAVFEAAKEAARRASLLCFETVSTPQEFVPNFFVDVTPYLARKLQAIGVHRSQGEKLYMDPEMVRGRAAHRGLQVGLPYAEAFWVYRWLR
jgi:LmbE family N-acetylglucosaminyl deacetylase